MFYFSVITIFPEVLEPYFKTSIIGRAQKKKVIKVQLINPRNFVFNRHRTVDDNPYGGGPGMVMKPEPLIKAVLASKSKIKNQKSKVILLSPRGKQFNQAMARNLAKNYKNIILICGRYEGIDERVKKITKAEEISIGPYVLTGGELAALAIVDGVLGKEESLEEKKGSYPVYTRPEVLEWQGKRYRAPKVLVSGNHKKIEEWRRKSSHLID